MATWKASRVSRTERTPVGGEEPVGQHGELLSEAGDVLRLARLLQRDGAVGDLHVPGAQVEAEPAVVLDAALGDVLLEQRPAEEPVDARLVQAVQLLAEAGGDQRGA